MTTYYISKTGNNAWDGLSATYTTGTNGPKATMFDAGANLGAYEVAIDNDIILFTDGDYTSAEIETSAALGYMLISKALTIDAVNPYAATLRSSVVTAGIRINGALANKTITIGKIILDYTTTKPNYGLWLGASSGPVTLNFSCQINASVFYSVYNSTANTIQVILNGTNANLTADRAGINTVSLGTSSQVTLTDVSVTIVNKLVSSPAIDVKATTVGCTASIINPIINITYDATFPAQADFGVRVLNINNALIYNLSLNTTTASTTGTTVGAAIDCDDIALTAHYGKIINGTYNIDSNGGIAAIIGHDTSSATDNLSNFGLISKVTVNGGTKFIAGLGHAITLANCSDGFATLNKINGAGLGCLLKATTRGEFNSNSIKNCSSTFIQIKGCTDSKSNGNEVFMDTGAGIGISANANGVTNSTTCTAQGNIIHVNTAATGQLVVINPSQGVTPIQNIYNILSGATLPATVATVGVSPYNTISSYVAAEEISASILDVYVPETLGKTSQLSAQILPGIYISL